ncbi:MAG: type II/IV secretion system protein [Campylobacterales bacterium]|nr:type II/IV secretion system protein [Campylobacterales bacterium]
MIREERYHNTHLPMAEPEGVDFNVALKNHLLFTTIDDALVAALSSKWLIESSNHLNKIDFKGRVMILDDVSYDLLHNKYLEAKTDKEIASMKDERDENVDEEELSLEEFLRTSSDILTSEESAPIIKFVNALFYQAVKKKVSDIHIETHENRGEVRFRSDGILFKNADMDRKVMDLVISRIKIVSNLDISEKRLPQDGRTQVRIAGENVDIRVSVLPTFYGERVVMRILMQGDRIPELVELGFNEDMVKRFEKVLHSSHGIILVTGPTGSGKTTTLHSFLQYVASPEKNIITVEDPVEYKAANINQIQVNEKVGLTFASALRSILRQDPDTIMIGEIRDEETAQIAVRAALTGHLVFSTLHTNSAAATLTRLSDMGIEPFLISSSLLGVLAQRLVRKLCPHCKEEDEMAESYVDEYGLPANAVIYKAVGCSECGYSGYSGREALGELLIMDDGLKILLKTTTNEVDIRHYSTAQGLRTIPMQLREVLLKGETSLDEAIRIGLHENA